MRKRFSQEIIGVLIVFAAIASSAIFATSTNVFSAWQSTPSRYSTPTTASSGTIGNADGGGNHKGACDGSGKWDGDGGCTNMKFFWIKVPVDSDHIPFDDVTSHAWQDQKLYGGTKWFVYHDLAVNGKAIDDCLTGGGAAYILVSIHYAEQTPSVHYTLGLGAGTDLATAWKNHYADDEVADPLAVGEYVPWESAHAAFEKHGEFYRTVKNQDWSNSSSLTYFCADITEDDVPPPTTTTPPPPTWAAGCDGERKRYRGKTTSRIAVTNASLDSTTKYDTDSEGKANWTPPGGLRVGYPNDSGWTDSGGDYYTIAKPGDSIEFSHELCVNARYVRRVETEESFEPEQKRDVLLSLPDDKIEIKAAPTAKYAFGDAIEWMNEIGKGITLFGKPDDEGPIVGTGNEKGRSITKDKFGIGALSPTINVDSYNCHITQYDLYNPFRGGGYYQIPGWVYGYSCASATETGVSETVGEGNEITQYHKFNKVKAWEKYYHSKEGGCTCNSATHSEPDSNGKVTWTETENGNTAKGLKNYEYDSYTETSYDQFNRKEWKCKEVTSDCYPGCDQYDYPNYKTTCKTSSNHHSKKYDYTDDSMKLKSKTLYEPKTGDSWATKYASVKVPFNFETKVKSDILNEDHVVFQGGSVDVRFDYYVYPRQNPYLTKKADGTTWPLKATILDWSTSNAQEWNLPDTKESRYAYATYTPQTTKVQFIEFLIEPDRQSPDKDDKSDIGNYNSSRNPCAFYKNTKKHPDGTPKVTQCQIINEINGPQNPTGKYLGSSDNRAYTRIVPDDDEYVGFKYCVAMGFYPSDSHGYKGNTRDIQVGTAMRGGDTWNVSNAVCRTITKKPSTQVWNGSVYTEGDVKTSISKKITGHKFTPSNWQSQSEDNYNKKKDQLKVFGSWTDYAIIARGDVKGMSSGAVLGYSNNYYDLHSEQGKKKSDVNLTKISPITIANTGGTSKGHSKVKADASINQNLERLISRYREKVKTFAAKRSGGTGYSTGIYTAETGMQYAYVKDNNINLSSLWIDDGSNTLSRSGGSGGDLYKGLLPNADSDKDNTLVIVVDGILTIDQNICLGSSCQGAGMKLIDYSNTSTNAASRLPQVLIFADSIHINESVTRVDAWLIAVNKSKQPGEIKTCNNYSIASLEARDANGRYDENVYKGSYGNCYKTLIVNGPIYAKTLTLGRTAGAYHNVSLNNDNIDVLYRQYGSIGEKNKDDDAKLGSESAAEIFNLRADVYIWAYNQAQRYSEAVVTYLRELAPRY